MRYALISDIHANLPALDAVLADTGANGNGEAKGRMRLDAVLLVRSLGPSRAHGPPGPCGALCG
jgi:hypothetical protein